MRQESVIATFEGRRPYIFLNYDYLMRMGIDTNQSIITQKVSLKPGVSYHLAWIYYSATKLKIIVI